MISWILEFLIGNNFFRFMRKSFDGKSIEVSSKRVTTFWICFLTGFVVLIGVWRIYQGNDVTDNYLIFVSIMLGSLLAAAGIILLENINLNNLVQDYKSKKTDDNTNEKPI